MMAVHTASLLLTYCGLEGHLNAHRDTGNRPRGDPAHRDMCGPTTGRDGPLSLAQGPSSPTQQVIRQPTVIVQVPELE